LLEEVCLWLRLDMSSMRAWSFAPNMEAETLVMMKWFVGARFGETSSCIVDGAPVLPRRRWTLKQQLLQQCVAVTKVLARQSLGDKEW
jgi:hypothetical protein